MDRRTSQIKFVGLHGHSVIGSPFDAFGFPEEHMEFCYQNGGDALALTEHGNMNGMSYQVLHAKKMNKAGKQFKPIYGCEVYYHESIEEWENLRKKKEELEDVGPMPVQLGMFGIPEVKASPKISRKKKKEEDESGTVVNEEDRKVVNPLREKWHLVVLAQNQTGLNNLFYIVSKSFQEPYRFYKPRVDFELLKDNSEGLIVISGCLGGTVAGIYYKHIQEGIEVVKEKIREQALKFKEVFGDRYYGEVQWNGEEEQHIVNQLVFEIYEDLGIEVVSTVDSHYPRPDAWKAREIYKRLGYIKQKEFPKWLPRRIPEDISELPYELYPKNGDEVWQSYKRYSEECNQKYDDKKVLKSIEKTWEIAFEQIEDFYPENSIKLPTFIIPEDEEPVFLLKKKIWEGMKKKGKESDPRYIEQIKHELDVIVSNGFVEYLLTTEAITSEAQEIMFLGPGRGSGAGSCIAYFLGITLVDPLRHDLMFSRFMTKGQTEMPDFDLDFSDADRLKMYLKEIWGDSSVVHISNFNTFKLSSLIKDIVKFYQIPFSEANAVTRVMMNEALPLAKEKHGITAGVYSPTFEEVLEFSPSLNNFLEKYPRIKEHIPDLLGQIRSTSRHAGGVIISDNLERTMPLITGGGILQTPWSEGQNVRHLEPFGFIKFDLLGLETLSMFEQCIRNILFKEMGKEPTFEEIKDFYDTKLHPDKLDLDDRSVYENVFHSGKFLGIFQFTGKGAQEFCLSVKPSSIVEISAVTSIYRPGPRSANVEKLYIESKNNPEEIEYIHPLHKEVTESTFGFLVFQEQIAQLASKLGKNISEAEGHKLRKMFTKKGIGDIADKLDDLKSRFIEGCIEKGIEEAKAVYLFELFEFFSGYGFNKSHAISYSIISYQCAWLFTKFPTEWICAYLDKEKDDAKMMAIANVQSAGYQILPVDINKSQMNWIEEKPGYLRMPLIGLKGLGEKALDLILESRPFATIEELLFGIAKPSKKILEVLAISGSLDSIMDKRFENDRHFVLSLTEPKPKNYPQLIKNIKTMQGCRPYDLKKEKIPMIANLTGNFPYYLLVTNENIEKMKNWNHVPISEYEGSLEIKPNKKDKKYCKIWFIVLSVERRITKSGNDFYILKVSDPSSGIHFIKWWDYEIEGDVLKTVNSFCYAEVEHDEKYGLSIPRGKKVAILERVIKQTP